MSRNGSGTYSLPAGNPVTSGTTVSSTWANNTLSDIASALTQSVSADGQTPVTGNVNMNAHKVIGLADATTNGDAVAFGQMTGVTLGGFVQALGLTSTSGVTSSTPSGTGASVRVVQAGGYGDWQIYVPPSSTDLRVNDGRVGADVMTIHSGGNTTMTGALTVQSVTATQTIAATGNISSAANIGCANLSCTGITTLAAIAAGTTVTAGTDISCSGQFSGPKISLSAQPSFHALRGSGNQQTGSTVILSGTQFNTGSCYDASTGVFTAPSAGVYLFTATIPIQNGAGTNQTNALRLAGAATYDTFYIESLPSGNTRICNLHAVASLANGETVSIVLASGSFSSSNLFVYGNYTSTMVQFSGAKLF